MPSFTEALRKLWDRHLGFLVDEEMVGEHEFEPGLGPPGKHPMSFTATWGAKDLRTYLNPLKGAYLVGDLEGNVTVGGLCRNAPCKGSIELSYLSGKLIYRFDFRARGKAYHFLGEKRNIRPWNLHVSHTTLYGDLTDASGRLVSRSVTRFHLRALPAMVLSFRLV
ncbi:MAG: hypothetical protein HYY13_09495 [Nitrospirae bacterium]|nr:hypothetical protein [Nitrospirota bacterium]